MNKILLLFAAGLFFVETSFAQSSAFTYQGRLMDNGAPANSTNDLRFRLFSDAAGNNQIGTDQWVDDLAISNGLFTVQLNFGPAIFSATNYWLEVGVRPGTNSGAYTILSPH